MRIGEATNESDLISALEQARARRLELRRGFETVWWNNVALVLGDHQARWDPTLGRFEDRDLMFADLEGKKPKIVINHALTVGRTELAKLTKTKPIMDIMANSDESTDLAAAKVGRSALDYAEWRFKLPKMRRNALWWMIQTGLGAIYTGWDPQNDNAGYFEFLIDPATGDPVFDPDRIRELQTLMEDGTLEPGDLQKHRYPLGELEFKVYSPFQLLPDETKTELEEIQDLITSDVVDVDVLKGMYPKSADRLRPDDNLVIGTVERRMLARAGIPGGFGDRIATVENGTQVFTYWLLPNVYRGNKYLKNGKMVRWTQNKTVLENAAAFPFQDNRMPFSFFQHIPTSAAIWPDCVMNHIRGPNLEIDKTVSQLIENKDYMANPMWLVATQHRIKGEVKNVAGGMVRYRHVPNIPPPAPVQGMQMPQQVEQILESLREQILDISGQSEVARGRVPQGARSGVAVAYLQEEDDTKIAPTVQNMEEVIAYMGSLTLERFNQFYVLERIIRFYRRDGVYDARKFKGADLKDNTDVVCQAGSAMPKSKASKQQYTLELVSLGILKDPHKIQQMLELGEGEPDDVDKAIAQANRENAMMMYGSYASQTMPGGEGDQHPEDRFKKLPTAVPVKAWHNHEVHIARHTSVMMDEEFDRLVITDPAIVRLFDEHLAMHQQQLAQQQQAAQQQLMAAKGAPDGPPTPPGGATNGGAPPAAGTDPTLMSRFNQPDVIGGGVVTNRATRST
jgi:hypothetical protein